MFRNLFLRIKKFWLSSRFVELSRCFRPYDGRRIEELSTNELIDCLELIEAMKELDEELLDILEEEGDVLGILKFNENQKVVEQAHRDIKRSLLVACL